MGESSRNYPTETDAQRAAGLAKANAIRATRAAAKRSMSIDGAIALVFQPPVWAQTWKMSDLLESVPGVGPKTRARMMTRARIADGKVVGSLSESQKDALVEVLRGRAGARRS